MSTDSFVDKDRRDMASRGIREETVAAQLAMFRKGTPWIRLHRPCTIGDGITVLGTDDIEALSLRYEEAVAAGRVMKFVPASGAASRMFQSLMHKQEGGSAALEEDDSLNRFVKNLSRFAFHDDLEAAARMDGGDLQSHIARGHFHEVLELLLAARGLNCANLPKALIKFHRYDDCCRTALDEHVADAAAHTLDRENAARLHFTVSPGHDTAFQQSIQRIRERYRATGIECCISSSHQHPSTDTIAADSGNQPFRDHHGRLVFRPGGHGALLENLQAVNGDIVHLNNIDNVVHGRLKAEVYRYKRALGGYIVALQDEIFAHLRCLEGGQADASQIGRILAFGTEKLSLGLPSGLSGRSIAEQSRFLYARLNRPLRVCGVVQNLGEPGGGPFWTESPEGAALSLQIVEKSQVDASAGSQRAALDASTHFNPVDIVCGMRDYRDRPFRLEAFRDADTYFISDKTYEGRSLRALEHPGLWNGAMAHWNTAFVEVPLGTFNPVKTVFDLLRPEHQA